jgi:hypothetical protein
MVIACFSSCPLQAEVQQQMMARITITIIAMKSNGACNP